MNPQPGASAPARARVSVFIATSVDGFIARPDGAIDWLLELNRHVPAGEDCGYAAFVAGIDAIVMGRLSFETVAAFAEWPYGEMPVIVLSRGRDAVPAALRSRVSWSNETPAALCARLAREGRRHLYIDGGLTVQAFLADGLVDELTITTVPVLLGAGRRLFGDLAGDVALEHVATRSWPFGFVQTVWRVQSAVAGPPPDAVAE